MAKPPNSASNTRSRGGGARGFIDARQTSARGTASSFAPKTAFGVWFRNTVVKLMGLPFVADMALGSTVKDDFELPEYGLG